MLRDASFLERFPCRFIALSTVTGLLAAAAACTPSRSEPPSIRTVNGTASEEARADQLRRVLDRWNVEPWTYTREIRSRTGWCLTAIRC